MKIWNFVITGGPCGGKTTALETLRIKLQEKGYKVIIVSETATELILSGIDFKDIPVQQFQKIIFERSFNKENTTREIANFYNKDVVIFYDRGLLDGKAYISEEEFNDILEEQNITEEEINKRYDAVFHLVSTACGEEESYTTKNNKARRENIDEAKKLDKRTRETWKNHPHLKIIYNYQEFEEKISKLLKEVFEMICKNS